LASDAADYLACLPPGREGAEATGHVISGCHQGAGDVETTAGNIKRIEGWLSELRSFEPSVRGSATPLALTPSRSRVPADHRTA
jgi:hypothetical protein